MKLQMEPGKYVVAVSGGVDSMVLLDVLRQQPGVRLTVAHFDHGMRPDSKEDRLFVQAVARTYGLPFVYDEGNLGQKASEATARAARYAFLYRVREVAAADAVITAHHQDDVLETAILNMLRGTGRKGLSSLQNTNKLLRPLLEFPKQELVEYAHTHNLQWREDSTNTDVRFARNYVRHKLLPRFDATARQRLLDIIAKAGADNRQIDALLTETIGLQPTASALNRDWFIMLPHDVAREVLAAWLRAHHIQFDKKTINRITTAAKTLAPGKQIDIDTTQIIVVESSKLALAQRDR